jgi:hypothetical protein
MTTKKDKLKQLLLHCFFMSLFLVACNDGNSDGQKINTYKYGRYQIKERFENGIMVHKQSFNQQKIPDGAETEYYSNGKTKKFKWYGGVYPEPFMVIYYDTNGKYTKSMGNPFLLSGKSVDGEIAIELIQPPNLSLYLSYFDSIGNKRVSKKSFDPGFTDSTCWVTLEGHKFEQGHRYSLAIYFLDTALGIEKKIDSFKIRLVEN